MKKNFKTGVINKNALSIYLHSHGNDVAVGSSPSFSWAGSKCRTHPSPSHSALSLLRHHHFKELVHSQSRNNVNPESNVLFMSCYRCCKSLCPVGVKNVRVSSSFMPVSSTVLYAIRIRILGKKVLLTVESDTFPRKLRCTITIEECSYISEIRVSSIKNSGRGRFIQWRNSAKYRDI